MDSVGAGSADFRSIVLRGRNVASFKFALAKSILTLAESGKAAASLEELAVPFSQELCAHIKDVDTQSTSVGSRFLDACRHFNAGRITEDELVSTTALLGFNNVIDAFHVVGSGDVATGSSSTSASSRCAASGSPTNCFGYPPSQMPASRCGPRLNHGGGWWKAPGTSGDPPDLYCRWSTTGQAR